MKVSGDGDEWLRLISDQKHLGLELKMRAGHGKGTCATCA